VLDYRDKDYASALERANTAAKYRPDRAEVLYFRAVVQHELGNDEAAIRDMERAEQLFPPSDKRRRDASAWLKEFKKAALTPLAPDKGAASSAKGLPGGNPTPKLDAPRRPQLGSGRSDSGASDDEA
jgi:tetratricopeptide (TPR) repeat protein